jgi:hypothetical protein
MIARPGTAVDVRARPGQVVIGDGRLLHATVRARRPGC